MNGLDKAKRLQAERVAAAEETRAAVRPLNPRWPFPVVPFDAKLLLKRYHASPPSSPGN